MRTSLHVISSIVPTAGGTSVSVPGLAAALHATGRYDNELLTYVRGDGQTSGLESVSVPVTGAPWKPLQLLLGGPERRRLGELIRSRDIIHIHGLWQPHCSAAARLATAAGVPYVVSAHGMLDRWALSNKRWKKALYWRLLEHSSLSGAACLRALTEAEVGDYRSVGLIQPAAIIPNGVVASDVPPDEFWNAHPDLKGSKVLLFLSRVHYKKGVHLLCRVWLRLARDFPDWKLVFAGPDCENTISTLKPILRDSPSAVSVRFVGMLDQRLKWSALRAASVFVLPSFSEGFSVAVLEALAAGLPVVISRPCNFSEVASAGAGLEIEPREDKLAAALQQMMSADAVTRRSYGLNGVALVNAKYAWSQIGHQMADVYDWILGGGPPPPPSMCFAG